MVRFWLFFQPLCCNTVHYWVSALGMERTKRFCIHTHQSLYQLHLARLCWTPFYREAGFLCSVKRNFWPYWRNSIAQLLQICWLLWCKSPIYTTACQMCFIGWRSGDCRGHLSTVKLCSKKHFEIIWAFATGCVVLLPESIRRCYTVATNRWTWLAATLRCLSDVKCAEKIPTRNPKHWY